jgi:hypothetical protein
MKPNPSLPLPSANTPPKLDAKMRVLVRFQSCIPMTFPVDICHLSCDMLNLCHRDGLLFHVALNQPS